MFFFSFSHCCKHSIFIFRSTWRECWDWPFCLTPAWHVRPRLELLPTQQGKTEKKITIFILSSTSRQGVASKKYCEGPFGKYIIIALLACIASQWSLNEEGTDLFRSFFRPPSPWSPPSSEGHVVSWPSLTSIRPVQINKDTARCGFGCFRTPKKQLTQTLSVFALVFWHFLLDPLFWPPVLPSWFNLCSSNTTWLLHHLLLLLLLWFWPNNFEKCYSREQILKCLPFYILCNIFNFFQQHSAAGCCFFYGLHS